MTETGQQTTKGDLPVIVLVGRPNVGKSTLFNRLTRSRRALVASVPGTTRDRREGTIFFGAYSFTLVDTGGMGFDRAMPLAGEVEAQIAAAVGEAALIWLIVDGKEGLSPFDRELNRWVMRQGKPCVVVVNKVDNLARREGVDEFHALGSGSPVAVSAAHGSGLEELLAASAVRLPALRAAEREGGPEAREAEAEATEAQEAPGPLRVAFLGRPNVGKSSLINRILGAGRLIVSEMAGTTREAVEVPFSAYGQEYVLVDTAGLRRRSRTREHLDKLGALHALGALNRVDVAVLVLDASEPLATQDAHIARAIQEHQRAVVLALNKWDRLARQRGRGKAVEADVRERLRFLDYATLVRTSAADGGGLERLFRAVEQAAGQFGRQIQTADLNRVVQAAVVHFSPPAKGRSATRVYYGLQVGQRPPTFRFFTNHAEQIDEAYARFFENQLRYHFGLKGTPIRIQWRNRRGGAGGSPPGRRSRRAPG